MPLQDQIWEPLDYRAYATFYHQHYTPLTHLMIVGNNLQLRRLLLGYLVFVLLQRYAYAALDPKIYT